jgi:CRP/FNR family cyclic AMP-dependent transcriptional regulator
MHWEFIKVLEPEEIASLFDKMKVRTYRAGSIVFMPEDPSCEHLYYLKQGRVDVYRLTADGKRLVVRQVMPGILFGIRALAGRNTQNNFAEAIEESLIGIISREEFLAHLKSQPDFMLRILKHICNGLCLLEERLLETVYNPVSVRLAYFLLNNADPASGVLNNVTHEEIGSRIGAVRQTVTETLSLLRRQGLVSIKPKQIHIINRPGLEKITHYSEG